MFEGKCIVLGVTGSIAVYKAVDLTSKLTQAGVAVDVVMTEPATRFVSPLSFQSITHRPVYTDMWAPVTDFNIKHVSLAERADLIVIAPATANSIAMMARGLADDLLTCTVLSTRAPILIAPAMDVGMYENEATQANLEQLRSRGHVIVGPASGRLASGLEGAGRLVEIPELLGAIYQALGSSGDLAGKKVIISAGGTREPIDPVRYIGNYSSGKMGFALAEAARDRGASVTLIKASTSVNPPEGVELIEVQTAEEMRDAVLSSTRSADVLIMAAAVADYRPSKTEGNKIKREQDELILELTRTTDIIGEVPDDIFKVGFAAESENLIENATRKLKAKNLDLVVANDITAADSGFGSDTNRVIILHADERIENLPVMSKYEVAHKILNRVVRALY
ncbi:MAG: bifunctional phosphopantothenoylcysteine decarboxylase/phosphopantothenate--cysteine ligase CoaBC [Dehalococcoidia bacterium]